MRQGDKAYIPPTCPALGFDIEKRPLTGWVAEPGAFRVIICEPDGALDTYHSFGEFDLEGLGARPTGARARAIEETCDQTVFKQSGELQRLDTEPDIGQHLGEVYCQRIKACAGTIIRDGKPVCAALDPLAFKDVIAEIPITPDPQ